MSLLENLNPEQLAAVTLPHQSALILAGAGSGKTRVLTTRIAWLLGTGQASPLSILAVTFTNKAAKEMLTRLSTLTPVNTRGMWIGTFHGLCNRMLRAHYRDAGLPQLFQILDTQDQLSLIKRMYKAHSLDDERFPPRQLQWFIAGAKEEAGGRTWSRPATSSRAGRSSTTRCTTRCASARAWSTSPSCCCAATSSWPGTRACASTTSGASRTCWSTSSRTRTRCSTGGCRCSPGPHTAVFAVGDDDQSIYAFRGANVANMQHFERDFGSPTRPVRLIKLEQNYRSHGHILDAANALIRHNRSRLGKELWTSEGKGEPVRAFAAPSDLDEAAFVVDSPGGAGDGLALDEVALLYRSNAQSRVLEHALFNAGLPYRVYGGMRFFERAEVKHALAYLRLIAARRRRRGVPARGQLPPRGIGARTLEKLQDAARAQGASAVAGRRPGRARAARRDGARRVRPAGRRHARRDRRPAAAGSGRARDQRPPASRTTAPRRTGRTASTTSRSSSAPRTGSCARPTSPPTRRSPSATAAATRGAAEGATDPLTAFLAHAALEAGDTQAAVGRDALQLMTVHSAKGLEFHTVFVTGLEEGLFRTRTARREPTASRRSGG
ncbi:MAG: UvrD-helicase domain-containing protein [Betaproteobacteria bacterium]|nr:UvrD-helicase domain-containing protein [Betaproteobacteria bacterium]